ncbi:chemotaxis response regulator protein-glutamate methylesterase [Leptospira sp. 2 VSF19]|uniref:Protein-glutamate methylesterase/protein-glutamine glutaminase n=1 Tax=Leptospira soteropolitanensis TaxID=2950025 RepID=A0AAW5VMU1_9LEPT|nr:chemotaxis response regulator protein-glutamate methylesterase [Leptospira soteropolitanensis]MCW7492305.1 chemotaxis response regulator protein-glutamate methylesterase [Leptospira soteropolitanensis]MCW7499887.1 chemotaxis response regulator protein-glutamate methylesterase [Leptospira soteropolitanensis]MCW7522138.1 chemotaxis response regulator protein-glutamate methylesterase [Leptospira soteropolitanensis]MCW7525992.1 chemotaxis response regulator protein-glutamate methylesterase [Lept
MKKIKVFVIDDSAVVRQVLTEIFKSDSNFEFLGSASDPIFALDKMNNHWPDVIVLDIEMPRMDGLSFLKKIMEERPTPVVICSTLTAEGSDTAMLAMSLGACDIITKPKIGLKDFLNESTMELTDAVLAAASVSLKALPSLSSQKQFTIKSDKKQDISQLQATEKIVAIGTSTGGTIALEEVLTKLPRDKTPGIVIVQHMPEKFTETFAKRLDSICEINVREAKDGDRVVRGLALIAPGNRHMTVKRSGAQYFVEVADGPLVNRHKPSVDVLFRSVARQAGKNSKGIIMTGMGDDGASGLLEMKEAGADTIAQNEETSVVFGMPREAIKRGGVNHILPLSEIYKTIVGYG